MEIVLLVNLVSDYRDLLAVPVQITPFPLEEMVLVKIVLDVHLAWQSVESVQHAMLVLD